MRQKRRSKSPSNRETHEKRASGRARKGRSVRIEHRHHSSGGEFVVSRNRQRVAEMTYDLSPTTMAIDHTFVEPALRGQRIGEQLIDAAVAWARAHQRRIVPICPFVRAVFDRSPEKYGDIRA